MPDPVAQPGPTSDSRAGPRSRKRRRKVILTAAALLGTWWLCTRGFPARWAIQRIVHDRTGLDLRAGGVSINFDGSVDLFDARVVAADVRGPAANVVEFAHLHAEIGWRRALADGPRIILLSADGLVSRLSQSDDDATLNSSKLVVKAQGGARSTLPAILINSGRLEIGEHKGDDYTPLKVIAVRGSFQPSGVVDEYSITFDEVKHDGMPALPGEAVRVRGTLAPDGLDMELTGLTLDQWQPASAPSPLRSFVRDLRVEGRITRATLHYSSDEKLNPRDALTAALFLEGVGLSLPVEPPPPDASDEPDEIAARLPPTGPLRMTGVSGQIRYEGGAIKADLRGLLEEFPYSVTLDYQGVSRDAPFRCVLVSNGFVLGKHPQLFRFAKPIVAARLNLFSEPTGIVDSEVTISRDPPTSAGAAEVRVGGVMRFRDTRAAFKRFPYEFRDMRGTVRFTDSEVLLEGITGTAPSGATIIANGRIAPLTAEAGVDLDIVSRGIPIDDTLIAAMGPVRRRVIDRLCDRDKFAKLNDLGLINTPGRPTFELGGKGDVDIKIIRQIGPESIWNETIAVTLPRLGLVPQAFGVPVVAEGVRVVVQDDAMSVSGGTFTLPSGGQGEVIARANFGRWSDPDARFEPDIRIAVRDAEIDPLLIHALPGPRADGSDELRRVLSDLRLGGSIDADVHVASTGNVFYPRGLSGEFDASKTEDVPPTAPWMASDDTAFAARLTIKDATASPDHAAAGLASITGEVLASDAQSRLDLLATLRTAQVPDAGRVLMRGTIDLHREQPDAPTTSRVNLRLDATALDAAARVEDVVRVVSAKAAEGIQSLRADYQPEGRADLTTTITGPVETGVRVAVDLLGADALRFNTPSVLVPGVDRETLPRVTLGPIRGVASSVIERGASPTMHYREFQGVLRCDDAPAGELFLSGDDLGLKVRWVDAPFESPLVRALASGRLGRPVETAIRERNPRGTFGLELALLRPDVHSTWNVTGSFLPTSLAFDAGGKSVAFDRIEGLIEFDSVSGSFQNMRLVAPLWSAVATGTWYVPGDGSAALKVEAAIRGQQLTPDLRALLPANVDETLTELKFDIERDFKLPQLYVEASWEKPAASTGTTIGTPASASASVRAPDQVLVTGALDMKGMKSEVGVPVVDADGLLDFRIQRVGPRTPMSYQFLGAFDSVRAANVMMTGARLRIESGTREEETFVPLLSADCHDGRVVGEFEVRPTAAGQPRRYNARLQMSGVRLNPMLDDITSNLAKAAGKEPAPRDPNRDDSAKVDAGLTLGGLVGDDTTRRGRGFANVGGGEVLSLPVLLPLIQVSNLRIPTGQKLHLAQSSFYLQGPTVFLEEVSVFSDDVEILGFGTLSWPDLRLDLLFNSRAQGRVPVVSWFLEGLRNELVTTTVGGTLGEPQVSLQQFRETRAFLGRVFGAQPSAQDAILRRLEGQVPRGSDRIRINPSSDRRP